MKKSIYTFLACLLLAGFCSQVHAQFTVRQEPPKKSVPQKQATPSGPRIEFTPFSGYQLNGSVKFINSKFKMENAMNYGAMLSVEVDRNTMAEFVYSRSDTKGKYHKYNAGTTETYDMSLDYFQLGVVKEVQQGKVVPYGTFTLGATWFNMKDAGVDDEVFFSLAGGAGVKVFLSDRIGIRLQGRLMLPLDFWGGGFFVGIGSGGGTSSGVSLNSSAVAVQGDFTGGLIIRLGS